MLDTGMFHGSIMLIAKFTTKKKDAVIYILIELSWTSHYSIDCCQLFPKSLPYGLQTSSL